MEPLDTYLKADGTELPEDVLDRIDEIVPPGATVNVSNNVERRHQRTDSGEPAALTIRLQSDGYES